MENLGHLHSCDVCQYVSWTAASEGLYSGRMSTSLRSTQDLYCFGTKFAPGLISDVGLKVCTLERPTRDISSAEIQCPGQAPVELVRLMEACRKENPRERPSMGDVCDTLEKHTVLWEGFE